MNRQIDVVSGRVGVRPLIALPRQLEPNVALYAIKPSKPFPVPAFASALGTVGTKR
jgi:hypothetical protein